MQPKGTYVQCQKRNMVGELCGSKGERGWLVVVDNFISLTLQHLIQHFHKAGGGQEVHSVLT